MLIVRDESNWKLQQTDHWILLHPLSEKKKIFPIPIFKFCWSFIFIHLLVILIENFLHSSRGTQPYQPARMTNDQYCKAMSSKCKFSLSLSEYAGWRQTNLRIVDYIDRWVYQQWCQGTLSHYRPSCSLFFLIL